MWIRKNNRNNKVFNVFTCDFETMVFKGKHLVVSYVIYGLDGKVVFKNTLKYIKWSGNDEDILDKSDELLYNFIKQCDRINSRIKDAVFYFHNFSRFDGLFVMNHITSNSEKYGYVWSKRDVFIKNNRLYTIKIKFLNGKKIVFRDSYLIMNMSLENVGKSVGYEKDNFKFESINNKNLMNDKYLEDELLKYNSRDCEILYKGIHFYYNLMIDNYNVSIYNYLTSSSLSLGVYLRNYYKDYTLYKESEQMEAFIRQSYYGGSVDVYKPYGENINEYDVTSLYPAMMRDNKYPVGKGTWVNGSDCELKCKDRTFFGILECEIISPKKMYLGLIHCRDKTTTCVPRGQWKGVITSVEYYKAIDFGYRINILRGVSYESDYIFKDYVDKTFGIRKEFIDKYGKSHGFSGLIKLQMNSLYGILGMKTISPEVSIMSDEELNRLSNIKDIISIDEINKMNLVKYDKKVNHKILLDSLRNKVISLNEYGNEINKRDFNNATSCIQIATFVTAYSRCLMFDIKNKYKERLYYSDTDSIFIDGVMDTNDVSDGVLGKMEFKNNIDRGYFIAPKFYMTIKDELSNSVVKGVPKSEEVGELVNEEDFIKLLNESGKTVSYERVFDVKFKKASIESKDMNVNLKGKLNARMKVFDKSGKWVNTYPLEYKWGKIIS